MVRECEKNQGIREIPRKCQGLHVFPESFYAAGDYMKSLNFWDYLNSLVTHIPCNIYNNNKITHKLLKSGLEELLKGKLIR